MLSQLTIINYTTVKSLELDFNKGMTVITGETGSGKSVILGALGQVIGSRADSRAVRPGADRADIHALFDIKKLDNAKRWLRERDLLQQNDCLLRRVITSEGRSRAYINGQPTTVQDLKAIGTLLIDMHSQHEHQSLLKRDNHRTLLDTFAGLSKLARETALAYQQWKHSAERLQRMSNAQHENNAQAQLLEYQLSELAEVDLEDKELGLLEQDQKRLSNGQSQLAHCQQALDLCSQNERFNLSTSCTQAKQLLAPYVAVSPSVKESCDLLSSAEILLQEAAYNLQTSIDELDLNPQTLRTIELRLNLLYDLARKHRVNAQELPALEQQLQQEFESLQINDEHLEELQANVELQEHRYLKLAQQLSDKRKPAASKLELKVKQKLKLLSMGGCQFEVQLSQQEGKSTANGLESVEFLISTLPGQAPQALSKVASGGELSRISLAIQVVTASKSTTPILVFDEVDVGIGGAVANTVGELLRSLAQSCQILCVTHLPQVAALGHQHLSVRKKTQRKQVATELSLLQGDAKIDEIARMLGGVKLTDQSRAHAQEMLASH